MNLVSIVSLITAAGTISGIIFWFVGYAKGAKKESRQEGKEQGSVETNINYIKTRLDDMVLEQRDTNRKLDAHSIELSNHAVAIARVEESAKSAHKRIDQLLEEKGGGA